MVTDILAKGTELLVSGDPAPLERAFGAEARDGVIDLPGVMSRKKQVAPRLLESRSTASCSSSPSKWWRRSARGAQPDLLEARQMQALSLAVHIPIVCFGIAFPAMFLFVEGLYLRTGDPTYKALAKRWSKVAVMLFAVGVVTGTILSFEFGLLWPEFMATLRRGVRDRVRARGDLVLRRGDLHRDLRLRLGPARRSARTS